MVQAQHEFITIHVGQRFQNLKCRQSSDFSEALRSQKDAQLNSKNGLILIVFYNTVKNVSSCSLLHSELCNELFTVTSCLKGALRLLANLTSTLASVTFLRCLIKLSCGEAKTNTRNGGLALFGTKPL